MKQVSPRAVRIGVFGVLGAGILVWFYTPAPTAAALFVWTHYQAGALALTLDRTNPSLAFSIGNYYFGNQPTIGKIEKRPYELPLATRAFTKALAIQPSFPLAHYMRGRIAFIRSDFDAALADFNAEFALNAKFTKALYMRGLTYAYRDAAGDLSLAEADFRTVVASMPFEWAGYNDLAFVLAKENKFADAAITLKEGIAKATDGAKNPWLWNTLGVMQLNLKEYSAAITSFTTAQAFADTLTDIDWQRAYPGNNPAAAADGLEAMKAGIARNLVAAYAALNN